MLSKDIDINHLIYLICCLFVASLRSVFSESLCD
jgi:hypothetical protein